VVLDLTQVREARDQRYCQATDAGSPYDPASLVSGKVRRQCPWGRPRLVTASPDLKSGGVVDRRHLLLLIRRGEGRYNFIASVTAHNDRLLE
jgi:hypothetical protein